MHIRARLKVTVQPGDQRHLLLHLGQRLHRGRELQRVRAHLQVRGLESRLLVAAEFRGDLISFPGKKRTPHHADRHIKKRRTLHRLLPRRKSEALQPRQSQSRAAQPL